MSEILGSLVLAVVQLAVVLVTAPFVAGIISQTKARLQNRRGGGLFQPYRNLIKLFHKECIIPTTSSWVFRAAPYIVFMSTAAIVLLVPTVFAPVPLQYAGDIIMVVGLFALGRFFLALAGLDAGSAFGGLGSSREMSIAAIIEPAMMLAIFTVAVTAGSTNLSTIVSTLTTSPASIATPSHILAFAGLFIVTLAESGRIPVDNPTTHLELTMIHEAMILDYSGRHLALMEWASQMKLTLFLALLSNMFFPFGMATTLAPLPVLVGAIALLMKLAVLAMVIGVVEMTNAKLRLFRIPELLMVAFILSLIALILYFIIGV